MLPKRCSIEILSTVVNTIIGPYRVYDPTRYLQVIPKDDKFRLYDLFKNGKWDDLCEYLDGTVELGKDRAKRYIWFHCTRHVPILRSQGKRARELDKTEYLKHVSKTILIKRARAVTLKDKKEVSFLNSKLIKDPKSVEDIYGLNDYFLNTWISNYLEKKAFYPLRKFAVFGVSSSGGGVVEDLKVFISLYISRKQGWI